MPEAQVVRAGPVTFSLERENGFLRSLRVGDVEVVRTVYCLVREVDWSTPIPTIDEWVTVERDHRTEVSFRGRAPLQGVPCEWSAAVIAESNGRVTYRIDFYTPGEVRTNRSGLCLLHPVAECAGKPVIIEHPDGKREPMRFPDRIDPNLPFPPLQAIEVELARGVAARIEFEGIEFETEDQRNWSDASFKTYCGAASRVKPIVYPAGTRFRHEVRVIPLGLWSARDTSPLAVTVGSKLVAKLPTLGTRMVRGFPAPALGATLCAPGESSDLPFAVALRSAQDLDRATGTSPTWAWVYEDLALLEQARRALPNAQLFFARNGNFVALNGRRPDAPGEYGLAFGIDPQVHTWDERSMLESTETHEEMVRSAREFRGGKPVAVGPIGLGRGGGPDPRLSRSFGAVWTLSSLKHLALGGACLAIYYDSEQLAQSPRVSRLLSTLHGWRDRTLIATTTSHPQVVQCLASQDQGDVELLLANMTDQAAEPTVQAPGKLVTVERLGRNGWEPCEPAKGPEIQLTAYEVQRLRHQAS